MALVGMLDILPVVISCVVIDDRLDLSSAVQLVVASGAKGLQAGVSVTALTLSLSRPYESQQVDGQLKAQSSSTDVTVSSQPSFPGS